MGLTETPNLRESDVAARLGEVLADPLAAEGGMAIKPLRDRLARDPARLGRLAHRSTRREQIDRQRLLGR